LKGYDTSWDRLSRKARKMQPWCSHCGAVDDLTTDHSPEAWAAKAAGKRITLNMLTVLCRPCNSAKGAARGNNAVTRGHGPSATIREPGGKAEFELHTENVPVTVAGKPKKGG
jgi:5-methylcytosine-specific restriction endonuclease McrA